MTQGQWKAVMRNTPSRCFSDVCKDDLPVQNVRWNGTIAFLNKLSTGEGLTACYEVKAQSVTWYRGCTGYRLPTAAEWEYACRAGWDDSRHPSGDFGLRVVRGAGAGRDGPPGLDLTTPDDVHRRRQLVLAANWHRR